MVGLDEKNMTPIQEHIFGIMAAIHDFCETHKIQYFLAGGTLLGAIRHKGFIPWDDDADIYLLRSDYERFIALSAAGLPEGLALRHYSVEKNVTSAFAKIVDTRVRVRIPGIVSRQSLQHVCLDVFPLDSVPQNALKRRVHY